MKKNLIFKLGFIFASFLIILTACDLGTKQWANLTFSIEGPTLEGRATQEGRSSSSRYIHPDANYLIFELFSGEKRLDTQTISIKSGTKSISITVKGVPLNDPNLRAEIKVWGNGPTQGADLLGQNSIHLGRIGLGYTKLTLGVKPVGNDLGTATYEEEEEGGGSIFLSPSPVASSAVWKIQMHPEKGLYTISDSYSEHIYLYDSDGKNYQNSLFIGGEEGPRTLVFYHPEDKASTYFAYLSGEAYELNGYKLEQDILVTQYDDNMDRDMIVGSEWNVYFGQLSPEISFTIYNPYPSTLNLKYKIDNAEGEEVDQESKDKFKFTDFPEVLLPGKSKKFTVNFQDNPYSAGATYKVKSTISAPGLKDFVLHFTGSTSGI